jgi:chemotaxis protein MotB
MHEETEAPEGKLRPIIRRMIKKKNKHHGGSWKIAYADFVTAMMAFFLLMWLLSLLNKYQLQGVSNYFKKPLTDAFTHQENTSHKASKNPTVTGEESPVTVDQLNTNKDVGTEKGNAINKGTDITKSDAAKQAEQMKLFLEKKLNDDPQMRQFKNQLNFIVTADGLKIQLHDLENKPMFTEGKTDFQEHAKKIMDWLSAELNTMPNQIMIIGHTDSQPYFGMENYSNWELSADRANATRRALIDGGMDGNKIIRVVGVADTELLNKDNSYDPKNRRIEIIVLSDEARKKLSEQ